MLRGPAGGLLPGVTWAWGPWRPGAQRTLICHRWSEWFNIRPLMDSERRMSRPRTGFPRRTSRLSRAGDGPAAASGPSAADLAPADAAAADRASPGGRRGPGRRARPGPVAERVRGDRRAAAGRDQAGRGRSRRALPRRAGARGHARRQPDHAPRGHRGPAGRGLRGVAAGPVRGHVRDLHPARAEPRRAAADRGRGRRQDQRRAHLPDGGGDRGGPDPGPGGRGGRRQP